MDKRKLLVLSIILTSGLHQKLMQVSAQETTPVEPKVETSTESMPSLIESSATDSSKIETTSAEVTETTLIENTSRVSENTEETSSETITLSEVETVMGDAVIDVVNNLREINGLNRLNRNENLTSAAKELVALKPISDEFKETYGDAHAQDQVIADKHGYQSDFTPANHLHLEVKLSDYQGKSLTEIASQFVNKWYLDMSNPDLAHRKQMLTNAWQETGIGVSIAPKFILGDLNNTNIKSKFGDVIVSKNTLELLDGFDIHISQYFGSTESKKDYRYVDHSVSLPNYADYVESQIGQTEVNPMTGQEVTLDSSTAKREIRRQRWDNYLGNQPEELQTVSVDTETEAKILEQLLATKSDFDRNQIEDKLQTEILDTLNDELTLTTWSNPHTLVLTKEGKTLGHWKLSPENGHLLMTSYTDNNEVETNLDDKASLKENNIFSSREEAIKYGESILVNHPDHYLTIVKMKDEKYSVWFPEKRVMTEEMKLLFEHYSDTKSHVEDVLHDLKLIYKNIDADIIERKISTLHPNIKLDDESNGVEYYLRFTETSDIEYGKVSLEKLLKELNINIWNKTSHLSHLDSGLKSEYDFLEYYSDREQTEGNDSIFFETIDLPYNLKILERNYGDFPSTTSFPKLSYLLFNIDKVTENFLSNQEVTSVRIPGWDDFYYKEVINEKDYYHSDLGPNGINYFHNIYQNINEALDTVIRNYHKGYAITLSRSHIGTSGIENYWIEPYYPLDNNSNYLERFSQMKSNIYIYDNMTDLEIDGMGYNLWTIHHATFDVYNMGGMYSVQYNPLIPKEDSKKYAYNNFEAALNAAKQHVESNPKLFYDIFKVDDTYIVKYSENRIQTRWNPDNMYFDKSENAEKFAQYISSQVRDFDYEIIPDRIGFYRIKTKNILFKDDQDGLFLIPEYIGTGNSGSLGQNMPSGKLNLTDMYQEFRRKPGTMNPEVANVPMVSGWDPVVFAEDDQTQAGNSEKTKVHTSPSNSNHTIKYSFKAKNKANQVSVETRFSRVRFNPSDKVLQQLINFLFTDLFSQTLYLDPEIKERFDLFYQMELMFKDLENQELSEPTEIQILLYDGEEVEEVVLYDTEKNEDIKSLDFEIKEVPVAELPEEFASYDKTKIKGDTSRILVFSITTSGDYGIQFKK